MFLDPSIDRSFFSPSPAQSLREPHECTCTWSTKNAAYLPTGVFRDVGGGGGSNCFIIIIIIKFSFADNNIINIPREVVLRGSVCGSISNGRDSIKSVYYMLYATVNTMGAFWNKKKINKKRKRKKKRELFSRNSWSSGFPGLCE